MQQTVWRNGVAVTVVLGALAGCASMSEKECRRADWPAIGQRDGAEGWPASRLSDHAKACREVGVVPDAAAWERGRQQGLQAYCQPHVGRSKGIDGTAYRHACGGPAEAAFLRGYAVGQEIRELKKLQDSNRTRRKELLDRLGKKDTPAAEGAQVKRELERLDEDDQRLTRLIEQAYKRPI